MKIIKKTIIVLLALFISTMPAIIIHLKKIEEVNQ